MLDKGAEILQEGVPCARRFRFVLRVVEADRAVVRHGLERPVPAHRPLLSLRFVQHVAAECEIGLRIAQQPQERGHDVELLHDLSDLARKAPSGVYMKPMIW